MSPRFGQEGQHPKRTNAGADAIAKMGAPMPPTPGNAPLFPAIPQWARQDNLVAPKVAMPVRDPRSAPITTDAVAGWFQEALEPIGKVAVAGIEKMGQAFDLILQSAGSGIGIGEAQRREMRDAFARAKGFTQVLGEAFASTPVFANEVAKAIADVIDDEQRWLRGKEPGASRSTFMTSIKRANNAQDVVRSGSAFIYEQADALWQNAQEAKRTGDQVKWGEVAGQALMLYEGLKQVAKGGTKRAPGHGPIGENPSIVPVLVNGDEPILKLHLKGSRKGATPSGIAPIAFAAQNHEGGHNGDREREPTRRVRTDDKALVDEAGKLEEQVGKERFNVDAKIRRQVTYVTITEDASFKGVEVKGDRVIFRDQDGNICEVASKDVYHVSTHDSNGKIVHRFTVSEEPIELEVKIAENREAIARLEKEVQADPSNTKKDQALQYRREQLAEQTGKLDNWFEGRPQPREEAPPARTPQEHVATAGQKIGDAFKHRGPGVRVQTASASEGLHYVEVKYPGEPAKIDVSGRQVRVNIPGKEPIAVGFDEPVQKLPSTTEHGITTDRYVVGERVPGPLQEAIDDMQSGASSLNRLLAERRKLLAGPRDAAATQRLVAIEQSLAFVRDDPKIGYGRDARQLRRNLDQFFDPKNERKIDTRSWSMYDESIAGDLVQETVAKASDEAFLRTHSHQTVTMRTTVGSDGGVMIDVKGMQTSAELDKLAGRSDVLEVVGVSQDARTFLTGPDVAKIKQDLETGLAKTAQYARFAIDDLAKSPDLKVDPAVFKEQCTKLLKNGEIAKCDEYVVTAFGAPRQGTPEFARVMQVMQDTRYDNIDHGYVFDPLQSLNNLFNRTFIDLGMKTGIYQR